MMPGGRPGVIFDVDGVLIDSYAASHFLLTELRRLRDRGQRTLAFRRRGRVSVRVDIGLLRWPVTVLPAEHLMAN